MLICLPAAAFTKTVGADRRDAAAAADRPGPGGVREPGATGRDVRHSPDARGIVGLETWLWLAPGTFGELRGSSAEGLVAVAEPDGTTWTTGDGGSVSCAGGGMP